MDSNGFFAAAFALAALATMTANGAEIGKATLISHRGESVDAPENTLPAYKTAVERGFGFECDVYLSTDGRVFTFHDSNLKRTSGGASTKKCSEASWADDVSKLDVGGWGKWKGSKFEGTRPALLEEVLDLAVDGRKIYVEVKPGPEIVPYIKDIFAKQSKATPANTLFISFNSESCKALKAQMPEYKVYWLTNSRKKWAKDAEPVTTAQILAALDETGADGVDCHFSRELTTAEMIAAVHATGREFHVWTVDKIGDALEAFKRGADTVTTNRAQGLLEEAAALKEKAASAK